MRRPRFPAAILALATLAPIGLAAAPADALAHSGQLSPKDDCHRHKAAQERHWHIDGTATRGGPCLKINGKTYYFGSNAICAAERAAISDAREASWTGSIDGEVVDALVSCVQGLDLPARE